MTNTTRILPFAILLFISCINDKTSRRTDESQVNNNIEFQNNYLNSPKLFSKFWTDMTERDFNKVIDSLKSDGKIAQKSDSLFYELDGHEMYFREKFENGKLKKITLTGKIEPLGQNLKFSPYYLFQEKYNLPNLINRPKYYNYGTASNPDYEPIYQVFLRNGIAENVPNYLIDHKPKEYRYQLIENEEITRLGIKEPIELNKDGNTKIYIKEIPSQIDSHHIDIVYSLEDWKNEIPLAIKIKYNVGPNQISVMADDYKTFNDQKPMETIGNYLVRKNSKFINRNFYQNYDMEVTYTTKEYHISEQTRLKDYNTKKKELEERIDELNQKGKVKSKREALEEI